MLQFCSKPFLIWMVASIGASIGLAFGLSNPDEKVNRLSEFYLPGETTSGHYQIELNCSACHDQQGVVQEQKCIDCHQADLKASRDTHPKSKFADPTKIVLLEKIAANNCITCHREHDSVRTTEMGLTVPQDYCWHCHEDVAEERPSHSEFTYDTCLNAGCHNYHDNTALYENFLSKHFNEPDHLENPQVMVRERETNTNEKTLSIGDADAPEAKTSNRQIMTDWSETAHAMVGVNCSSCHNGPNSPNEASWSDVVAIETCETCHDSQVDTFYQGKHGMRFASGLSPMTPELARLPMHSDASHRSLDCSSCHQGHRFDTRFAAVDACLQCHNDDHSNAYLDSSHFTLWEAEVDGKAESGTGISCATCHMPRIESSSGEAEVMHNQNWNLQPNEKMARSVCMNCHGLQFTLDSLASKELIDNCFSTSPTERVPSLEMVQKWFEKKRKNK